MNFSPAFTLALATKGPSAYWYLTRSTGAVSLLLLTASVVLGVIDVRRWNHPLWPRFVVDALHRNVSLLALAFVVVHVVTAALDSFAPISVVDAVVPFIGSYRPLWLGLGAVAFDLLLAVIITSLLRQRIGYRTWRVVHWLAYASWPVALLHTFGTGSDVKSGWLLALSAACVLAVLAAVGVRAVSGWPEHAGLRGGALASTAALAAGLLLWVPGGPLGNGWARRAGTPVALLAASASSKPKPTGTTGTAAPQGTALDGPFDANLSGSIKQEPGPAPGLVTVDIASTLSGSTTGRLDVAIEGQALNEGGVALSSSHVTLGSSGAPALYRGRITELSGNHIVATVRRGDGHALSLSITVETSPGGATVSGTVAASPL
jgi:methionine sulfoxide reductase heme-binding subunit